MKKNHKGNELKSFLHDLDHFQCFFVDNQADEVWNRVIRDVHEYEKRDYYKLNYGSFPIFPFRFNQSDRPDIIYQSNGFAMGIECFEFDSSKRTKKGSQQRIKEAEIDKSSNIEYQKIKLTKERPVIVEKVVDVDFSDVNYCESLLSSFISHAESIEQYRKNLSEKCSEQEIMLSFYISDVTAIGNYVIEDGKPDSINPFRIPLFLDTLSKTKGLDYVAFKATNMYVPSIIIQRITPVTLLQMYDNRYRPSIKFVKYQYSKEYHYW